MNRSGCALLLAVFLLACLQPPGHAQALNLEDQVIEHTLGNGLRVLMVNRHEVPRVVCNVFYKVGSVYERPGITGISHFHEHMMFKGTRMMGVTDFRKDNAINGKIDALMDRIYEEKFRKRNGNPNKIAGWEAEADRLMQEEKQFIIKDDLWEVYMKNGGTHLNASTGKEVTGYYVTLPSNKVELQMLLESDRMANPCFREFYSEKEVVREERRLYENRPGYRFQEQLTAAFFAASPYSWNVIGWDVDLQKITKQDLIEFNRKYYIPNNAVAVYVGDLDPDRIIALARKYFGPIPRGPDPEPVRTMEVDQCCEKRLYGTADTAPSVTLMYHVPPAGHPDDGVFKVISGIFNGRTGRFHKKLVEGRGLAVRVRAYGGGMTYAGQYSITGRPRDAAGHCPEALEKAILVEVERLKTEPVAARELQKVKNRAEAIFIRDLRYNIRLAYRLGQSELGLGWRDIPRSLERMRSVTAGDIVRVARKYFTSNNRTVGILTRKSRDKRGAGKGGSSRR